MRFLLFILIIDILLTNRRRRWYNYYYFNPIPFFLFYRMPHMYGPSYFHTYSGRTYGNGGRGSGVGRR